MKPGFCTENENVTCFLVIKNSWKGKYRRVFSVGTHAITTYNPSTLEITNQWLYEEFLSIKCTTLPLRNSNEDCPRVEEFQIQVRKKGGKNDSMKFLSEFSRAVVNEALHFHLRFGSEVFARQPRRFHAFKHGWCGDRMPIVLEVRPGSLDQVDTQTGLRLKRYSYKDIRQIIRSSTVPGGFVLEVGDQRRRHFFASSDVSEIVDGLREQARTNLGTEISIAKDPLSHDQFMQTRLGLCSRDDQLTPFVEFRVQKLSARSSETVVRRLLCISETCLMERDIVSYSVICARPLRTIVCLVRDLNDPQKFIIEYVNDDDRTYMSNERDSVLASLMDRTRASGNMQVFVTSKRFERSYRLSPYGHAIDEEAEMQLLKHINAVPRLSRYDMIRRFNANVPYNGPIYGNNASAEGFLPDSKARTILNCLDNVLAEAYGDQHTKAANGHTTNGAPSPFATAAARKSNDSAEQITYKIEAQLACLHRLFASKAGFHAFNTTSNIRDRLGPMVVRYLRRHSEAVDYGTVEMLCALMQPLHANYELRVEQLNKQLLLANQKFVEHLLQLIVDHVNKGTGSLVIASMLDFLTYAVCAPYSETTPGDIFDIILKLVDDRGRSFYGLFHSPSMTIIKGAGMVLKAIIEESAPDVSKRMQNLSLTEGAFLKHLDLALFSQGKDLRAMTIRQLSGQLISLWIAENSSAMDLLRRCIPRGLLNYLRSTEKPPVVERDMIITRNNLDVAMNETQRSQLRDNFQSIMITAEAHFFTFLQHYRLDERLTALSGYEDKGQKNPVVLRKARHLVKVTANWRMFYYQFGLETAKADLIWNEKTKSELKQAMDKEITLFRNELGNLKQGTIVSWNHTEFEVIYPSLRDEIRIGDYYLRFLLNENSDQPTTIDEPLKFFNNVYHRFLLATRSDYKCVCLKAMGIVYGRHFREISSFPDSAEIVDMMSKCMNVVERDHYVFLISKLVLCQDNVRDLITAGVVPLLIDLASLAHLHVNRAKIHSQTNVIESGSNYEENQSAEWHYKLKDDQRIGPFSFEKMKNLYAEGTIHESTSVWAEGLTDWCVLSEVPQFRWTVICERRTAPSYSAAAGSTAVTANVGTLYNLTELCEVILDTLIQMCKFFPSCDSNGAVIRPLPRVKRILSMPVLLYPVVQLLLTYDPSIVCRVAHLLYEVMQHNPSAPSLYLSGVFFFILMYNGSNIFPVAHFLYETHKIQAFNSTARSEMSLRSILCPLLPEAMIYYLDQYGAEEYAQKFLGEFEEPEIIWNSEMRRFMIEKIALHVFEFTSRLSSNVKVLYNFCPIALIEYPQLEGELFCHFYYLRHLTDETKFPNHPIRKPVEFLRACLATWEAEIRKKPSFMSIEQACKRLNLKPEDNTWKEPGVVRKAYFSLAPKYHPDRNPDGREQFERINAAYEFLSSTLIRDQNSAVPNFQRIVICLRAQTIVYKRHLKELSAFKYAGYENLVKTIELEAADDMLFSVDEHAGILLIAAVELCYWTLRSAPLNAEQLRRDQGLDALYKTFERCSPMILSTAGDTDMPVKVCMHVCNCFAAAAKYEACRERICEMKDFFRNLCRLLKFEHLTWLACTAAECICAFSVSTLLQTQLFQAGVIWQLIPHLFRFDYTLDEGGVAHAEESNQQAVYNRLARSACEALSCLAGYRPETPDNDGVQNSLHAMLTPFVCHVMANGWPGVGEANSAAIETPASAADKANGGELSLYVEEMELEVRLRTYQSRNDQILKLLNSNVENPYIIWDNGTRAEMLDFVERHRTSAETFSELFGAEFRMSIYAKELVVGDIFIRIYNDQPNFNLYEPRKVCADLLDYLQVNADELLGQKKYIPPVAKKLNDKTVEDLIDLSEPEPTVDWSANTKKTSGGNLSLHQKVSMVLEALSNVLKHNSGVEALLIGNFQMIFGFLRAHHLPEIQRQVLEVIWIATRSRECIVYISASIQLPLLLVLLVKLPTATSIILSTLITLVSNGSAVKETLEYGGLIYILNVLIDSKWETAVRQLAAQLLARLQSDKLTGPKWTRYMSAYLPVVFSDYLRDDTDNVVPLFDSNSENPELVWNEEVRQRVCQVLRTAQTDLVAAQVVDPSKKWNMSLQDVRCAYQSVLDGEMVIGGVYLRLFIANPAWQLRHPRTFAAELMERLLEMIRQPSTTTEGVQSLDVITTAITLLFAHQTHTTDNIPAQGYLPHFCQTMQGVDAAGARAALLVLKELAKNEACSNTFGGLPVVRGLHVCLKKQPRLIAEAAHALKHLLRRCTTELAEQMLSTGLIDHLMKVLADSLAGVANPSAVKAEIVDALKYCCTEPEYGARINAILQKSAIWAQYRDQRHDLFLPAASQQNAIVGPIGTTAAVGYLTDTMFEPPGQRKVPPPISPKPNVTPPPQNRPSSAGGSGGNLSSAINQPY